MNTNKNDKNHVLEAFDYNFIIIISQSSKRSDQFKYAKSKPQSYWLFVKSVSNLCAQYKYNMQYKKTVKKFL